MRGLSTTARICKPMDEYRNNAVSTTTTKTVTIIVTACPPSIPYCAPIGW